MKKYFVSFAFVVLFAGYAAFQYLSNSGVSYAAGNTSVSSQQIADTSSAPQSAPPPNSNSNPAQTSPASVAQAPTPTQPAPAPKPQGQYVDGTYTGSVANAYYGFIQVQVDISGGKIADVQFLQYPSDRSTSRYINGQAMPILRQEAIQAQSAQVNGVSGASDTSAAFQQSLASALTQARS
jgi:uncharacterized protein with FMN-binding domain